MSHGNQYRPQALFQRILDEHSDWLFIQGYHEKALGNNEQPGRLISRLRDSFEQAIHQTLWHYRAEKFQIGTKGVYGPKKDPVEFTFHYQYDPARVRLELTQLTARLYEQTIDYPIVSNTRRQLPPGELAHAQLSADINKQLLQKLKEQKQTSSKKIRKI